MRRPIKACIFCGAANVTDEHVFSRWTHQYLEPRKTGREVSYQGIRLYDRMESRKVKLPGQLRDWQLKVACGGDDNTCNNGWMRRLENRTAPILKQIITGITERPDENGKFRMCQKDQELIAAWAVLTSIVGQYGEGDFPTSHHTHRKYLRTHNLAPKRGWAVWIGHFERQAWKPGWVSTAISMWPIGSKLLHARRPYFNCHSTTQVIGKLFIQVIQVPQPGFVEGWRFAVPHKSAIFRIWPPSAYSIRWPSAALLDRDADLIASAFQRWMNERAPRVDPSGGNPDTSWHPRAFHWGKK